MVHASILKATGSPPPDSLSLTLVPRFHIQWDTKGVREMAKAIEIASRMSESSAKDSFQISQSFIPSHPETAAKYGPVDDLYAPPPPPAPQAPAAPAIPPATATPTAPAPRQRQQEGSSSSNNRMYCVPEEAVLQSS